MPGIMDLFGEQAPPGQPVINAGIQANQQAEQQAQNSARNAMTAGAAQDIQQKQRGMQINMLSGILNEPDPDKQAALAKTLIPVANKLNPSFQIDENASPETIRALVQSQVSPVEQATLANNLQRAQMMLNMKAQHVEKDPATGQLVVVDAINGTRRPVTAQENEYYNATGQLPGDQAGTMPPPAQTGIFPNMGTPAPQNRPTPAMPTGQPQQPTAPPAFGFPPEDYSNSPNALKLAQKNAADFEKTKQLRQTIIPAIQAQIAALEPDLTLAQGGGYEKFPLQVGTFGKTDQGLAADRASQLTPGLALNLSQLQTAGGGNRAVKAVLQTLLSSKPDVYNNDSTTNISNLNHIKSTVGTLDLETKFLDAYKELNPAHVLDANADNLFNAMLKKYPLESVDKTGHVTYNEQNAQDFESAIPDAIANPHQYLKPSAQPQQAQQPKTLGEHVQQNLQTKGGDKNTPPSGAKKAPDGNWYVADPNRPGKYLQWQP